MQTVANKAKPVAAELMQNQVLPRMKDGEGVDVMAQVQTHPVCSICGPALLQTGLQRSVCAVLLRLLPGGPCSSSCFSNHCQGQPAAGQKRCCPACPPQAPKSHVWAATAVTCDVASAAHCRSQLCWPSYRTRGHAQCCS